MTFQIRPMASTWTAVKLRRCDLLNLEEILPIISS